MTTSDEGIVYDAAAVARILGLPVECGEPVPEAGPDTIVVWYGGWTLPDLRESPAGKKRMWQQDWYDKYGWKVEPGYYRLRLPVPDSNRKTFSEQQKLLLPREDVAPVTIVATALLVHLAATGIDLLSNDWCRCNELLSGGYRAGLDVNDGRVNVSGYWGGSRSGGVWLVGAGKC